MQDTKGMLHEMMATRPRGQQNSGSVVELDNLKGLFSGPAGIAGGALAGGLAGLLLGGKKSRKFATNALKIGGVAVVGGLAYKAYRDWQENRQAEGDTPAIRHEPVNEEAAFIPTTIAQQRELSRIVIRAMINAAKADGHIDAAEHARISDHLASLDLDAENRAMVERELAQPFSMEAVISDATTPELAAEIYAASLLAIDSTSPAEKGYLAMLAARLELDPGLVDRLHVSAATMMEDSAG